MEKSVGILSNSERANTVDAGSEGAGVSLVSERGKTQPEVKVPKCRLSVTLKGVRGLRQLEGGLRGSHPLKSS